MRRSEVADAGDNGKDVDDDGSYGDYDEKPFTENDEGAMTRAHAHTHTWHARHDHKNEQITFQIGTAGCGADRHAGCGMPFQFSNHGLAWPGAIMIRSPKPA